jgi:uncharacterized OB-fold protein
VTVPGKPIPVPTAVTAPYWEGCRQGVLRLQRCTACQALQLPPQRHCRRCLGDALEWLPAAGTGRIVSWTVVRHPVSAAFAADVPYVVAIVALDEGPTMMAGIRDCAPDALHVGMRVEVLFEARSDAIAVPYFRPADHS